MNLCNKILTFLTLLVILAPEISAQDYFERVRENKDIAAGVYHRLPKGTGLSIFPITAGTDPDTTLH